jgi:hypothetical protein
VLASESDTEDTFQSYETSALSSRFRPGTPAAGRFRGFQKICKINKLRELFDGFGGTWRKQGEAALYYLPQTTVANPDKAFAASSGWMLSGPQGMRARGLFRPRIPLKIGWPGLRGSSLEGAMMLDYFVSAAVTMLLARGRSEAQHPPRA